MNDKLRWFLTGAFSICIFVGVCFVYYNIGSDFQKLSIIVGSEIAIVLLHIRFNKKVVPYDKNVKGEDSAQ